MHIYKLNISQDYFIASIPTMKNIILNLPFKKLTSLFTAIVFFCNIIAPLPAMAQKNQPKKKLTLEQKIASINEMVTKKGIEELKRVAERSMSSQTGLLSPEECYAAKPQTIEQYVSKCLYGGALSEDDEIVKRKAQKLYLYQRIKDIYQSFNSDEITLVIDVHENRDDRKDMLEASIADILPEYYQDETALDKAYSELENYLKKETEYYKNMLSSVRYPKDYYHFVPFAQYPFPTEEATIANSPYFSQKGKLSKFFNYTTIFDILYQQDTSPDNTSPDNISPDNTSPDNLMLPQACVPKDFFANEKNSFVDFFRNCDTRSYGIPTMKGKYDDYEDMPIEDSSRDWIVSEPISQAILARYLKEFSSPPAERPTMLDYYFLLGFANMLASQSGHIKTKIKNDLNISDERDIEKYKDCQYALDKFEEYKNHLKQGNSKGGILALKKLIKASGKRCFSDFWWNESDRLDKVEKWENDQLSLLVRYLYGMKHFQVRRVIDITAANAHILMKALIYVDRYYGSDSKPEQPLPPQMRRIIEPILQKITGDFLKWDDFASIFRGKTLTTENINKEGAARHVTFGENLTNLVDGPIGNGVHYYAKNGVDNAWEDTKKQGRAALGMLQYLSPSFYISGEASKMDGDYAEEVAPEIFSGRTAYFVSGLLELQKPLNPAYLGRISSRRPISYWLNINSTELCSIGTENHSSMGAINNESCAIVDRAILEFQGAEGEYDRRTNKFTHSTDWTRQHIKHNVDFYLSAGEFARDFIVDGVVGYVIGLGFAKVAKFVKARKLEYATKTGYDLNKLSLNLKSVVKNRNKADSLLKSAKNKNKYKYNFPSDKLKEVEIRASKANDAVEQASDFAKKAQEAFEQGNNIQARYYTNKANELMGKANDFFKQAMEDMAAALGRGEKILYSNNGFSVVQKGNKIKIKYPGKSKKFTVDLKEGETFEVKPDGEVVITNSNGHIDSYPNLGEYRSAIIKQRNATSSNLRIVEKNGNTVVIKVGHNKQVKINLKEGDTLDINESGQLVFKDGKGNKTTISIDDFLKGKYDYQILGRSSAASGEAALEAHRGINGLMNKCPECFENKNFKQIGKIARDNKDDFFDPIFADPTSKDLAKELSDEILGKKIYECAEPLVKKSVASDMARDLSYVRIKLVKATNGGVKAMPSLELDIDQLLQRQVDFKSNLVKRTTWNGKKYGDPSEVYIQAKPNGKGGYSYTNSKGESFTISKVEYDDIASFVNGEQGGLYIDLGDGVSFSDFKGAVKDLQSATMKKLKAKYPNIRFTIKYGRGGRHEFGYFDKKGKFIISEKNTKQLFINEGEMKHFHMEYEIIDETGTSIFYNTTIRVKGTDAAFQNLVKELPVDGIFDSFASDAIRIQDLDDSNELFVEPFLISSYFIKEYDINGLYQNPLSCTNGRGFYFA